MDIFVASVWIALGVSILLTAIGLRWSLWKPLVVAAGLSVLAAIPLAWSIGPFVLAMASIQLGVGLNLRRSFHWWTPIAIVTSALCIWFATLVIGAMLVD